MKETQIKFSDESLSHEGGKVLPDDSNNNNKRRQRWIITTTVIFVFLIIVCIVALVLELTVFRIKNPEIELTSASIKGLAPQFSLNDLHIQFNVSMDLQIRVDNPNSASFKHRWGKSWITYRGSRVGEMNISSGYIPGHGSETFPCNLGLTFDAISTNTPLLIRDAESGQIVLRADTHIGGRVSFIGGLIKINARATVECDLEVRIPDLKIINKACRTLTKS